MTEYTSVLPADKYPRIFTIDGVMRLVDDEYTEVPLLRLFEPRMEKDRIVRNLGALRVNEALDLAKVLLKWVAKCKRREGEMIEPKYNQVLEMLDSK
jgi:uridine kinase